MNTIGKLTYAATEAAHGYRTGAEAQASESMIQVIDLLAETLPSMPEKTIIQLNQVLSEIFSAQQRSDFIWAADMLEYELCPRLQKATGLGQKHPGSKRP